MADATDLATAIAGTDIETALVEYEAEMFPRAEAAARASADTLVLSFGPDAPRTAQPSRRQGHGMTRTIRPHPALTSPSPTPNRTATMVSVNRKLVGTHPASTATSEPASDQQRPTTTTPTLTEAPRSSARRVDNLVTHP
jgi:hypothetical protein